MYYLGVDGGGSKTLCVVCDEQGQILGSALSGCGNHQVGRETARKNIYAAVDGALDSAGLKRDAIEHAVFGLAGADRAHDFSILRPMIADLKFSSYEIVCDTIIALRAGTHRQYGVVLICGTGTNCYGVNKSGDEYQCGGFGYAFGDFGGSELAVEAFRSVIRAWDGRGPQTLLTGAFLNTLGYDSVDAMRDDYLDHDHDVPAELVPMLFSVAAQDDEVARGILRKQGEELGLAAAAVVKKLRMQKDRFDLVLAGSILSQGDSRFLLPYIKEAVGTVAPNCGFFILKVQPVVGALLMAIQSGGRTVNAQVVETLREELKIRGVESPR
ncbi:MAG TPA: BadF/BadG/BcrA/BcrD ATPase family protein [Clostridia bacterium]|nr:BadF/BadG/BcrA/BcrD ATPase family protein [Clostridia bacterium]